MRIDLIDREYYVFRNGVKLTMTVHRMRTGELHRCDLAWNADKSVPHDVEKAIERYDAQARA